MLGFRVLMVALMIYQDYQLLQENSKLSKELKEMNEYFKENGGFEAMEKEVIESMKYVFSLIRTLVSASRATLIQYRKILLLNQFFMPEHSPQLAEIAKKFDPEKNNLDEKVYVTVCDKWTEAKTFKFKKPKEGVSKMAEIANFLQNELKIFSVFSGVTVLLSENLSKIGYGIE